MKPCRTLNILLYPPLWKTFNRLKSLDLYLLSIGEIDLKKKLLYTYIYIRTYIFKYTCTEEHSARTLTHTCAERNVDARVWNGCTHTRAHTCARMIGHAARSAPRTYVSVKRIGSPAAVPDTRKSCGGHRYRGSRLVSSWQYGRLLLLAITVRPAANYYSITLARSRALVARFQRDPREKKFLFVRVVITA